jgi:hypothetical protein
MWISQRLQARFSHMGRFVVIQLNQIYQYRNNKPNKINKPLTSVLLVARIRKSPTKIIMSAINKRKYTKKSLKLSKFITDPPTDFHLDLSFMPHFPFCVFLVHPFFSSPTNNFVVVSNVEAYNLSQGFR